MRRFEVTVGLMVDAALVPEVDQIILELERELEVLDTIGPVNGGTQRPRTLRPVQS